MVSIHGIIWYLYMREALISLHQPTRFDWQPHWARRDPGPATNKGPADEQGFLSPIFHRTIHGFLQCGALQLCWLVYKPHENYSDLRIINPSY